MSHQEEMLASNEHVSVSKPKIIYFSNLSEAQKEKYYQFLVKQNIQFAPDGDGHFVADIRVATPKEMLSTQKQISQHHHAPAPQMQQQPEPKQSLNMSQHSVSNRSASHSTSFIQNEEVDEVLLSVVDVYVNYCSLITNFETLTPRRRAISWLLKTLNEVYDAKYVESLKEIDRIIKASEDFQVDPEDLAKPFINFVYSFITKYNGLKSLKDQQALDLIYNVHLYRSDYLEVDLFARFLDQTFDSDDLLFFLYARFLAHKEMVPRLKKTSKAQPPPDPKLSSVMSPLMLNPSQCLELTRVIFGGAEMEPFLFSFTQVLDAYLAGKARYQTSRRSLSSTQKRSAAARRLELNEFLNLALLEYHHTKPSVMKINPELLYPRESDAAAEPQPLELGQLAGAAAHMGAEDSGPPLVMSDDLIQRLRETADEYLEVLMNLATGLPHQLVVDIHAEVQYQLHTKVAVVLNEVLSMSLVEATALDSTNPDDYRSDMDLHAAANRHYKKELRVRLETLSLTEALDDMDATPELDSFCKALLGTPELREDIEPLVAFLISRARAHTMGEDTPPPPEDGYGEGDEARRREEEEEEEEEEAYYREGDRQVQREENESFDDENFDDYEPLDEGEHSQEENVGQSAAHNQEALLSDLQEYLDLEDDY